MVLVRGRKYQNSISEKLVDFWKTISYFAKRSESQTAVWNALYVLCYTRTFHTQQRYGESRGWGIKGGGGWEAENSLTCQEFSSPSGEISYCVSGMPWWRLINGHFSASWQFLWVTGTVVHIRQYNSREGGAQMLFLFRKVPYLLYKNRHATNLTPSSQPPKCKCSILPTPAPAELFCMSNSRAVGDEKLSELPN